MLQGELIEVRSIESAVAALRNTTDLKSANSKPVLEEPGTENRPHLLLATRLRPATGPEKLWELCALHNSLLCCISVGFYTANLFTHTEHKDPQLWNALLHELRRQRQQAGPSMRGCSPFDARHGTLVNAGRCTGLVRCKSSEA